MAESAAAASDEGMFWQAVATEAEPASPPLASSQPPRPSPSLLYVATNLESWETCRPEPDQDEICERCGYRRLDPPYFAWLRSMMVRARQAHAKAQLPDAEYELLRTRFNAMQEWALARFGEEALRAAMAEGVPNGYRPPAVWEPEEPEPHAPSVPAHLFPADGDWPFTEPVTPEAIGQVDAVRERALALGWTEAALYQNRGHLRFPVGGEYGLVCLLHPGDRIGEITAQSIEIIRPNGNRLRHYNRAAPQPWLRRDPPKKMSEGSDISARLPVCNSQESS